MKLIKNGKLVLNGTRTEEETEQLCLKALEIVIDRKADLLGLLWVDNVEDYNCYIVFSDEERTLTKAQFELVRLVA